MTDRHSPPAPRLAPLPPDADPSLAPVFAAAVAHLGYVPNSQLIMQRKPAILRGFSALYAAVFDPQGEVDRGFKRLLAYVSSRSTGCVYCMAHTAGAALSLGISEEKFAAVWSFRTSPLYSARERVALEYAIAVAAVPNAVTDEVHAALRRHWSEGEIVEILAVLSLFGFLNRFNDSLATPLEDEPLSVGNRVLAEDGWHPGKHRSD
ncbi:MAG: carboxymuconolactone decarboxylase family protein [Lautropia sp.]